MNYAIQNGIIDLSYVQEQATMNLKKEILEQHGSSIWYNEKEKTWYCHIPDPVKGRVKRKRKNKSDIEEVLVQAYLNQQNESNNKTFYELFYEFIDYKKTQVGMGTIKRMMSDWNKFYLPNTEFTSKRIDTITKVDIDQLLNKIADQYKPKDKAFRNLCGILKQTLEYAIDVEYIEKSPYRVKINKKNIQHTRKKPSVKEVYTAEEREILFDEMERRLESNPSNTIPLAIMLDFETGVRVGELVAIRKSDIKDGRLHIHRQRIKIFKSAGNNNIVKETGWETVEYTKSDCGDRLIPLTDKAKEYIRRIIEINKQYSLINEDYLFVSPNNNNIFTEDAISAQLKRACEKVGIPIRRPHKIRKTYASILYQNGVPVTIISRLLGHADETTTLKHYIFNVNNDQETENIVLNALQNKSDINVTKGDQQIIQFPMGKKMGNPSKIKASQY